MNEQDKLFTFVSTGLAFALWISIFLCLISSFVLIFIWLVEIILTSWIRVWEIVF